MRFDFAVTPSSNPASDEQLAAIQADPGFGKHFSDHMVRITWTATDGWHTPEVVAYGPLALDPAAAVLHYAQEVFEGMKAYRHADDSIWSFRPEANAARFNRSARRMALPELPAEHFIAAIEELVNIDARWVPGGGEKSYYLRPFMFASEAFLGVRAANEVTFLVIGCPVGPYFAGGVKPVSIWVSPESTRAALGGTGAAKFGGNYAAGLLAQMEAGAHGCEQVVFLDAVEHRYIEELAGMNLFFVCADGTLMTPPTGGTILEGITRSSILELASGLGLNPVERPITIDEWKSGVASGAITEVFACGTAAVVTPVGRLMWAQGEVASPTTAQTMAIREQLIDIQYGRRPDTHGWMHRLV
jgi:branched-chain amino acid aminotransferase